MATHIPPWLLGTVFSDNLPNMGLPNVRRGPASELAQFDQPFQPDAIVPDSVVIAPTSSRTHSRDTVSKDVLNLPVSPEQAQQVKSSYEILREALPSLQAEEQGLLTQKARLAQAQVLPPVGPSLRAPAAWLASQDPRYAHLMKAVDSPDEPTARQAMLAKLDQAVQQARHGISTSNLRLLQAALTGGGKADTTTTETDKQQEGQQPMKISSGVSPATQNAFSKEVRSAVLKHMDKFTEMRKMLQTAQDSLHTKSLGEIQPIISQLVRTISTEVGNLTESDRAYILPRTFQGDMTKFLAYLQSDPSAQYDPEVTGALERLVERTQQQLNNHYLNLVADLEGMYRPSPLYTDSDQKTLDTFRNRITTPLKPAPKAPPKPKPTGKEATGFSGILNEFMTDAADAFQRRIPKSMDLLKQRLLGRDN